MTVAGTIEIEAHAPVWLSLMVLARWRRLSIEIDGELRRVPWGTHSFVAVPGERDVVVGLGMFAVKARATVHVVANEVVRLRFTPSWSRHVPGTLDVVHLPPARLMR